MPQVLPMTRVEAYLAYKAGVIQESDLKPTLKTNFYNGLEHWLAYWCGLCDDYPVDENNNPKWYNEEEYYVAYLCGIAQDYPTNCYHRVGAYLRHIISYRWPQPEKPLTREEYYLSLINSTTTSNPTPSSNFTLGDTTDGAFQGVEVYGDTFQQTYTGKNLMNATTSASTSSGLNYSGDTQQIYMNGTRDSAASVNWSNFSLKAGTYILMLELVSGTITSTSTGGLFYVYGDNITGNTRATNIKTDNPKVYQTITVTADTTNAHLNTWARATEKYSNAVIKYQLIAGSTEDYNFEPYVGGIPAPNPDYPQDINVVTGEQTVQVTGKNLLAPTLTGSVSHQGTMVVFAGDELTINKPSGGGGISYKEYTNLLPMDISAGEDFAFTVAYKSGTINIGGTYSYRIGVYGVKSDNTVERFAEVYLPYATTNPTASSVGKALNDYIGIKLGAYLSNAVNTTTGDVVFDMMLEKAAAATDYQPYQGQSYPLSLGSLELCKIGDYQDYIYNSEGNWYVRKAVGKIIEDGSQTWYRLSTAIAGKYMLDTDITGMLPAGSQAVAPPVFCSHFTPKAFNDLHDNGTIGISGRQTGRGGVYIFDNVHNTAASFQTWLQTNPMTIYYALATPTDEEITDPTLLAQLEALAAGQSYDPLTNFIVTATDPNLPALLKITAYKKQ